METKVNYLLNHHTIIIGSGRNTKIILIEDVRVLLDNDLDNTTVRSQIG